MPEQYAWLSVEAMPVGQSGFAAANAMVIDENRQCWLKRKAPVYDMPGATDDILPNGARIPRPTIIVRRREDGYAVDTIGSRYWDKAKLPNTHGYIRVAELL